MRKFGMLDYLRRSRTWPLCSWSRLSVTLDNNRVTPLPRLNRFLRDRLQIPITPDCSLIEAGELLRSVHYSRPVLEKQEISEHFDVFRRILNFVPLSLNTRPKIPVSRRPPADSSKRLQIGIEKFPA